VVATRLSGLPFPESGCGSGVLVSLSAHVDFAEFDRSGVVGEPVDDGVGGDSVGQRSGPVIGPDWLAIMVGRRCPRPARIANRSLAASGSMPTVRKSSMISKSISESLVKMS
jgi:hypothetical protein